MKPTRLVLCLFVLITAPTTGMADDLCGALTQIVGMIPNGLDPIEGDPLGPDSHYRQSKIQFSAGAHCAIEAHRALSCSWQPSTNQDLARMVRAVTACFPSAQQTIAPTGDDTDIGLKLEQANIHVGLTADVLTLDVGP